jgi:hypothetical protein
MIQGSDESVHVFIKRWPSTISQETRPHVLKVLGQACLEGPVSQAPGRRFEIRGFNLIIGMKTSASKPSVEADLDAD